MMPILGKRAYDFFCKDKGEKFLPLSVRLYDRASLVSLCPPSVIQIDVRRKRRRKRFLLFFSAKRKEDNLSSWWIFVFVLSSFLSLNWKANWEVISCFQTKSKKEKGGNHFNPNGNTYEEKERSRERESDQECVQGDRDRSTQCGEAGIELDGKDHAFYI